MISGTVAVEEGPVELTEPARVTVDVAEDEPGTSDAEIIWEDDAATEAPAQAQVTPARQKPKAGKPGAAAQPESTHEERVRRTAARTDERMTRSGPQTDQSQRASHMRRERRLAPPQDDDVAKGGLSPRPRTAARAATPSHERDAELPEAAISEPKGRPRRRFHALVFILVPLLVIATIGWRYRRQRLQELPLIAQRGKIEGIPALKDGDFDKAYQRLSAAKAAVDALGGNVDDAELIRNAADEAAIFVDLVPKSLEDLLAEAGRTRPDDWASKFDTLYKGRAILVDSWVTVAPEDGRSQTYEVLYRILPPGETGDLRDARGARPDRYGVLDFTGFQLFELARPAVGSRVTFGARLASFQYDGDLNRWVIRLEPKSGIFIQHSEALVSLGWPSASDIGAEPGGRP